MKKRRMIVLMVVTLLAGQADAFPAGAFGKLFKGGAATKESAEAGRAAKAADGVKGSEPLTAGDVYVSLPAVNQAAKQFQEKCASDEGLRATDKRPDSACGASDGRSLYIGNKLPGPSSSYLLEAITKPRPSPFRVEIDRENR